MSRRRVVDVVAVACVLLVGGPALAQDLPEEDPEAPPEEEPPLDDEPESGEEPESDEEPPATPALEVQPPLQPAAPSPPPASPAVGTQPAAPSVPARPRQAAVTVAVLDFSVKDVDERIGRIVTNSMRAEIGKLWNVALMPRDEMVRAVRDVDDALLSCAHATCVDDLARALDVDMIVTGRLFKAGSEVFTLRWIDRRQGGGAFTVVSRAPVANGESFLLAVGPAVLTLIPDGSLRASMRRGVSFEAAEALSEPPLPAWAFWTGVGISATTVAGAVAAGTVASGYPVPLVERRWGDLVAPLAGAGVVLAAATGAAAFFTDFGVPSEASLQRDR